MTTKDQARKGPTARVGFHDNLLMAWLPENER